MVLEQFRLNNKIAIITGAGRGIGAAVATTLAEAGADLVIGARSADELAATAELIEAHGRRAVVVAGDLSTREAMANLVDTAVREFGGVDVVVNNVGGSYPQAFLDASDRSFTRALDFNVTTAFNLTQLAAPSMLERGGGAVVNITSTAGHFAMRGFATYGTAKAALVHLTRELAQDLAPKIRVNAVSPGAIATSALDMVVENPELEAAMIAGTPMRRLGKPEEIAAAVLYLASPAAAYVTGEVLAVAGGIQGSNLDLGLPDL